MPWACASFQSSARKALNFASARGRLGVLREREAAKLERECKQHRAAKNHRRILHQRFVTRATPSSRRAAPAGRRFRAPAAPCARSPARSPTAAPGRRCATGVGPSSAMMRSRSLRPGSVGGDGGRSGSSAGTSVRLAEDRAQHAEHVGGFRHQRRALLEQAVGALRARIERRAGHREHLAALFQRHPRRDQRARAARRLDDDDAERQPRDQPVAAREIAAARLPAERHFADGRAVGQDRRRKLRMLGRIDVIVPAGQHRDGAAREACAMGGGIDAAREPRYDRQSRLRPARARAARRT